MTSSPSSVAKNPNRSGGWWFFYEDDRVVIDSMNRCRRRLVEYYWYEGRQGTKILSVLNESHEDQVIPRNGIYWDGERFPKYTELFIPTEEYPQGEVGDLETDYAMLLVSNLQLHDSLKMIQHQ